MTLRWSKYSQIPALWFFGKVVKIGEPQRVSGAPKGKRRRTHFQITRGDYAGSIVSGLFPAEATNKNKLGKLLEIALGPESSPDGHGPVDVEEEDVEGAECYFLVGHKKYENNVTYAFVKDVRPPTWSQLPGEEEAGPLPACEPGAADD